MQKQNPNMKNKFQSPLSIILLVGFFFLLLMFPVSSGGAQTTQWEPAWVDISDSGSIHIIGQDANAATKVESPIPAEPPKPEKPISTGPLAAISQFFSSFATSINTPSRETAGWETIFSDDLEGAFPGEWDVSDNDDATNGEYFWAQKDCRPNAGSYSAWVVGGGAQGSALACGSDYPDYAQSWMIYGPFSLADATDAEFRFMYWLNSEPDYDVLFAGASINGTNFSGGITSGTYDWTERVFDLTAVPTLGDLTGEAQVWVVIAFASDVDTHYSEGAYVDDIEVRKYVESDDSEVYIPLVLKQPSTDPIPNPTATATSEVVVPNDGNWSGTTSQGRDISLLVVSNGTEVDKITIDVGWGGACGGVSYTENYLYDAVINNGSFYKSQANGTEVEGTFTSATSASGDFYAVLEVYYPSYCKVTTSGTWTANYVP